MFPLVSFRPSVSRLSVNTSASHSPAYRLSVCLLARLSVLQNKYIRLSVNMSAGMSLGCLSIRLYMLRLSIFMNVFLLYVCFFCPSAHPFFSVFMYKRTCTRHVCLYVILCMYICTYGRMRACLFASLAKHVHTYTYRYLF